VIVAPFRESIKQIARKMQSCEEWLEMVRDLHEPIHIDRPPLEHTMRWAESRDLFTINALEGFVKDIPILEESLEKGDRCLLVEVDGDIRAFAWVTFRDYKLALWYTLNLPPGFSYLVYIFVHPTIARQRVGSYLLGSLMTAVRDLGCSRMLSGMYADWEASIRLHTRMGFRVQRRLTQCRWLNIFPVPPKEAPAG
jgi:GNAT superfamily N-acetyltransferase